MKTLDLSKPVKTIDGRAVRILSVDRVNSSFPVVALVKAADDDGESVITYTLQGRQYTSGTSELDLVNVPPSLHLNIYKDESTGRFYGYAYHDRLTADEHQSANRVKCIEVPFEP